MILHVGLQWPGARRAEPNGSTTMNTRMLAAVAASLFLASCGGGGGGGGDNGPTTSMSAAPSSSDASAELERFRMLVGGEPLDLTSDQIRHTIRARQGAANRFLSTDVLALSMSGRVRHATTCSGAVCSTGGATYSPSDLDFSGATYVPVTTRNGVSMVGGASRAPIVEGGEDLSAEGYGGWLKHNAFFAERDFFVDADNVAQSGYIYAMSIGNESGSNPVSGSAIWRGTMAGMDSVALQVLHGDTELTADFASSNLDVAFTRIYDDEANRRTDIIWTDVPLGSGGSFGRGGSDGDKIEGTFYGPDHEEVGGIFERDNIVGAFGAKRQ